MTLSLVSRSPEETRRIGERIGSCLSAGDLVTLSGELGGGKTLLAGGIAAGVGVPRDIPVTSPTYTIINAYGGRVPFYHADLYRIDDPSGIDHTGLWELLDDGGVVVVEWPERAGGELPDDRLAITLRVMGEGERMIEIAPVGNRAVALVGELQKLFDHIH